MGLTIRMGGIMLNTGAQTGGGTLPGPEWETPTVTPTYTFDPETATANTIATIMATLVVSLINKDPMSTFTVTPGYTSDTAFNPESTTLLETARVLGTLIDALKDNRVSGAATIAVTAGYTEVRDMDPAATTPLEMARELGTMIDDLTAGITPG